jgi:hypothetical protein
LLLKAVEQQLSTAEVRLKMHRHTTEIGYGNVVSDNVPNEIVITAKQIKLRLTGMGVLERHLTEQFLDSSPIEPVLHNATRDVVIYRGVA